jgi:hypothetical protein
MPTINAWTSSNVSPAQAAWLSGHGFVPVPGNPGSYMPNYSNQPPVNFVSDSEQSGAGSAGVTSWMTANGFVPQSVSF